jgi:ABC-type branched-subunit amino acid transport system substrate-binding protein
LRNIVFDQKFIADTSAQIAETAERAGMKIRTVLWAALIGSMLSGAPAFVEDLNIAVVGPMTGPIANIGDQFKQGAKAAAINAKGGRNGRQINLSIEDDVCDPRQAIWVANRIAAGGIKFVAGHACSSSSIPAKVPELAQRVPISLRGRGMRGRSDDWTGSRI